MRSDLATTTVTLRLTFARPADRGEVERTVRAVVEAIDAARSGLAMLVERGDR